ncbi:hypothetical protein GHT06_020214 [Daphnia sinensis]|uniref:Uncharacterized protein n=1 Tax=Daphnia sinensis TaxID=1820382 RepID=A0AAD5KLU5_9CRUS|nr:hypothetical protein GHT06_020214 [Daphnia sinensis]
MPYIGKQRAQGISCVRRKKPFVGKRQMRRRVNIFVATLNSRDDMNTVIAGDIVELDRDPYQYHSDYESQEEYESDDELQRLVLDSSDSEEDQDDFPRDWNDLRDDVNDALDEQSKRENTFNAAKKLLPRAVIGTDINTASEADEHQYGKGRRIKRPRIVFSPAPPAESENEIDSTDDEQYQHISENLNLPPPPKDLAANFKNGFCTSTQLIDDQESQDIISNDGSTQGHMDENTLIGQQFPSANSTAAAAFVPVRSVTPLIPVNRNVSPIDALYYSPSTAVQPHRLSTPHAPANQRLPSRMEHPSMQLLLSQASQLQFPMLLKENSNYSTNQQQKSAMFKVKVLRLLAQNYEKTAQLEGKMNMLMEKVRNALSHLTTENEQSAVIVDIPVLPLKTREDLVTYEQLITTEADKFLILVRLVKQIGGLTLSDAVKRAWERVLSLEVRAFVNLAGIRFAPEFEQVSNATLQEETRKAVKHAAETLRNKQQRALSGSDSDTN